MDWVDKIDDMKSSALKELANVGISHAATAICEITGEKIDVPVPELNSFSKEKLLTLENKNGTLAGAYIPVQGISKITETLIILSKQDALGLMHKFININNSIKVETNSLSLIEQKSIFSELATVIVATYFSAVSSLFNLKIDYDVPQISFGAEKLSNFINTHVRQNSGISIDTYFKSEKSKFKGTFLLIPEPNSLDIFFRKIGMII